MKVPPPKNCIGYLRLTSREIIIFESSTCTMLLLMLIDDIGVDVVLDNLEVAHLDDVAHIQLPVNSQLL